MRALSLCTCCRQYPGAATGRRLRSSHPAVSAFPEIAVGSACTSSFSRLARRLLALRPAHSRRHLYVTCYTEGFSHFVTSMTAPVASGWSVRRVGLAPTGKRRLLTAHANSGHSPTAWRTGQIGASTTICERVILKTDGVATARDLSSKWTTLHPLIMDGRPIHTPVTRRQSFTRPTTVTPGTRLRCFVTNSG